MCQLDCLWDVTQCCVSSGYFSDLLPTPFWVGPPLYIKDPSLGRTFTRSPPPRFPVYGEHDARPVAPPPSHCKEPSAVSYRDGMSLLCKGVGTHSQIVRIVGHLDGHKAHWWLVLGIIVAVVLGPLVVRLELT